MEELSVICQSWGLVALPIPYTTSLVLSISFLQMCGYHFSLYGTREPSFQTNCMDAAFSECQACWSTVLGLSDTQCAFLQVFSVVTGNYTMILLLRRWRSF